jgi:peptide/nickel transport system substrate-binding protein
MTAVLLAACGGGGAASATPSKPVDSGTLTVSVPSMPTGYTVVESAGLSDLLAGDVIGEGLTRFKKDSLDVEPDLATSWSSSSDATAWTFNLRQGVKWQDGQPFTADDVKFTFDLIRNKTVRALQAGNFASLQDVQVVSPTQVKLVLSSPQATLPEALAYNVQIVPQHLLANQDPNTPADFIKHPVGTGPFQFKESAPGQYWTVARNPNWWGGKAHLDQVVFKVTPDVNTLVASLRTNDIDLALIDSTQADALKAANTIAISSVDQPTYFYLSVMNNKKPFDDPRVRVALNYAVDKQQIIKAVLHGYGKVAAGPIPPVINWAYPKDVQPYPYDPNKAKQLLEAAGLSMVNGEMTKDGQPLTIQLTTSTGVIDGPQLAQILQSELGQVGIKATISLVPFAQLWTGLFAGQFQSSVEYLGEQPNADFTNDLGCKGTRNRFFYCNQSVDALMAKARATVDQNARAQVYHDFQKALVDDPPGIYLYYPDEIRAANKRLHGFPAIPIRMATQHMQDVWVSGS